MSNILIFSDIALNMFMVNTSRIYSIDIQMSDEAHRYSPPTKEKALPRSRKVYKFGGPCWENPDGIN